MAGSLLVGAEGVLLIPDEHYGASRPLSEGIELVMQMRHHPTTRTTIMVGVEDTAMAEHFMKIHGLNGVAVKGIAPEDRTESPALAQWYAIERLRASGPINLVLTAYPEVFQRCTVSHQPTLLFGRRGALGTQDLRPLWGELHEKVLAHRDAEAETMIEDEGL